MTKKIAVLGSTGSIGENALKVAAHFPDQFQVTALAAKSNIDLLEKQASLFKPEVVAVWDEEKALELQKRLPKIPVLAGQEGVIAVAIHDSSDLLLSAISGFEGVLPTLRAIETKKNIALANKEVLVAAGKLVMELCAKNEVDLIPVDSEHTALFQCLKGEKKGDVGRIILTASGGPFREYSRERLENVDIKQALTHPNYHMGAKVTIDSSTLMNKGLEMIEAHFLYGISTSSIEILVHPEQIIHCMVEFLDGSILAQMSEPDMLIPIQYALTYPERRKGMIEPLDFSKCSALHFSTPDTDKFRCLDLAYASLEEGGSMPCFMNAANETLVQRFLKQEIKWLEIGHKLENLMEKHQVATPQNFEELHNIDKEARKLALSI